MMSEWNPIETAPTDGTPFYAWHLDERCTVYVSMNDDGTYKIDYFEFSEVDDLWHGLPSELTHWQHVHEPPEGLYWDVTPEDIFDFITKDVRHLIVTKDIRDLPDD